MAGVACARPKRLGGAEAAGETTGEPSFPGVAGVRFKTPGAGGEITPELGFTGLLGAKPNRLGVEGPGGTLDLPRAAGERGEGG